jgi:glycosyltransferase involved in cell wall biosynthesis
MSTGFQGDGLLPTGAVDGLRILVVNGALAVPDLDAGSLRLFRIVETLADEGHHVTFISQDGYRQERATARLTEMGVDVFPFDFDAMRARGVNIPGTAFDLPQLLANGRFDVALLSFYYVAERYLPMIRALSPLTRVVIDTVDVHHVRERRGGELSGDRLTLAGAQETRRREQAIYGQADAVVVVSEQDAAELEALAPAVPRFVISTIHAAAGPTPGFDRRSGVVFVGSFPHVPNVDAILDFHRTTWPAVRAALPDAELTVIGQKPPPAVLALDGLNVRVTGWVPDVGPYLDRARVSVAPIRYGAGVKGKIGEALSRGLPVVTTPIGAEGMGLRHGETAMVAQDPEAFAAAIACLHRDRALWERMSAAGRAHIESVLGLGAARDAIRRLLDGVVVTPFVIAAGRAGADEAVRGYIRAFTPADQTSLVLTVPLGNAAAAEEAFRRTTGILAQAGVSPDAVADIQIAPIGADGILPGRAVIIADEAAAPEAGPAVSAAAPAERWRELAAGSVPGRRRRVTPDAAVVIHASDDAPALVAQLDAVRRADLPPRVDLIIVADSAGLEVQAVLGQACDARIVRGTLPLGRHQVWQLGADVTTAPHVIALAPLALPRPGFVQALVESLAAGAAIAGPRVAGAAGLRLGADGSLWPRAGEADGELEALSYDCLAAPRQLFADGIPVFPRGEGHVERQLAEWAAPHGGTALAAGAGVHRMPGPPASVIVCTRNRAEELPDGIALLMLTGAEDIVIVDNDSTDDTAAVAAEIAQRSGGTVRVVDEPRGGLCYARNAGAAAARHDLLLYVDDDARPAPGWLEHLSRTLARPGIVNAGGPISALWPEHRVPGWPGRDLEALLSVLDLGDVEWVIAPPYWVYGANWAIRRQALEAVGGFDPQFGPGPDARVNGDEVSVAGLLHQRRLGTTVYSPGAAVGHRISAGRIDDGFILHRALCVGVEQPRHARSRGEGDEQLLVKAEQAAATLTRITTLTGDLTVDDALSLIAEVPDTLSRQVEAAMALGTVATTTVLLGENEAVVGSLRLRIDAESLLRGLVAQPAAAVV